MFRRSVLAVLLAVALLAGLVGVPMSLQFGPAPAFAATELHFLSVARGEPHRQAVLAAVADFEKANASVKVVLSEIPFEQYFQKAAIALSSGSGIDVFDVDSPLVASYGHQGALLALDKYFTKENLDDITPAERNITQYKGKTISIPMGSTSMGLFVDVDLIKQAGLKVPGTDSKERLTCDQAGDLAKNSCR